MTCPNCQNRRIRHAEKLSLHFVRLISGSHKYYCGHCSHKWCARPKFKKSKVISLVATLFIISYIGNYTVERVMERVHSSQLGRQADAAMAVLSDPKLMKKIGEAGGNPREAMKQLSSSEKSKLKNFVMSSSDTDAIQERLKGLGITVDASTLARISKFKGNPSSAASELTADEKKRVKSELSKANLDPKTIKV